MPQEPDLSFYVWLRCKLNWENNDDFTGFSEQEKARLKAAFEKTIEIPTDSEEKIKSTPRWGAP